MPDTITTEQIEKKPEIIYAGEETVKELLARLKKLKVQRDFACGSMELVLQDLQEELRKTSLPFIQQEEVLEEEVKKLMPAIARTIKTENGAALYRKGYSKITYNTDALEDLQGDIKEAILPFRKESQVAPNVRIEVY